MHVRFSTALGTPILDERTDGQVGELSGIQLNPDTGRVEGFTVTVPRFLHTVRLFLTTDDIVHWGTRIFIRDTEVLAPPHEFLRLQEMFLDKRTILGQRILTESGRRVGICRDVQFSTKTMRLEWLFPRRLFTWGVAIHSSDIVEVRADAVVVRDLERPARESEEEKKIGDVITEITETLPRPTTYTEI